MEKVLKGRYEVLKSVGLGGMSEVWLALDTQTRQTVAVKVLDKRLTQDDTFARRFSQELAIARLLVHPGIPRLIDDGQTEDGIPFIVMEYVQGITLTEYIKKKGPLPIDDVLAIASQVLTILSYAYSKGIQAHRDIKPGNIMIDLRTQVVTVMDFGIAKTVGSSLTHSTVLYTPKYAAPEQLLPSKFGGVVDKRADLYALGVVLYEMLTGKAPFTGETPAEISGEQVKSSPPSPSSIRRDIPAPLSQVLLKCLQANPSHRYQTPEDLLQDLTAGHVREPSKTPSAPRETTETVIRKEPPVPLTTEPPPPRRRSRVLVPLLLTLLLAAIIPVTMLVIRNRTATVTITSTPAGAQVFLDGTTIGTTPLVKKDVAPGSHIVRVRLRDYEDYDRTLTLQAGDRGTVTAILTKTVVAPTTGTLTVTSSPSGASIYLSGEDTGKTTPTTLILNPGSRVLRLALADYKDYSIYLTVAAGGTKTVTATLVKTAVVPTTSILTVTSTPTGAQVFVDGNGIGSTPVTKRTVVPGTHTLRLTLTGYSDYSTSFTIPTGSTKTVTATLGKIPVEEALAIGDDYQGGVVAYILQSTDPGYVAGEVHGLIAATADQSAGLYWCLAAYRTTAVTGTDIAIGSGSANTDRIIAQNGTDNTFYAAAMARAYRGGGYADWYLPSKYELNRLYLNRAAIGGFAAIGAYWSSSEGGVYGAWCQYFRDGKLINNTKEGDSYQHHRVRAVRSF